MNLRDFDSDDTSGYRLEDAKEESKKLDDDLDELQEMLYAEHKKKFLIILQAMDAGGKDGVIRRVFQGMNPSGVRVVHFREPTPDELDHGFLWKASKNVPAKGEVVIFNRSYYESVLVERVRDIVSKSVWEARYGKINEFERILAQDETSIVKFYLSIDSEEQRKRLQERMDDPTEEWKFSERDLQERRLWPKYMRAYAECLARTSTDVAPWYVVPSNHKWFRDFVVARVLVKKLKDLGMKYPRLPKREKSIRVT